MAATNLQPVAAVARLLDLTERAVHQLAKAGLIPRASRGLYDLLACNHAYIRRLREQAAGRAAGAGGGGFDLIAERARLAKELADTQSMKNAAQRGELIPASDVEELLATLISNVQRRCLAIPSKVALFVARENQASVCQAILQEHIREALQELSEADLDIALSNFGEAAAPDQQRHSAERSLGAEATAQPDGEPVG